MSALGLFLCLTGPALPAVFGTDDRQPLPAHHKQLASSVGILMEARSRTICTAFCVGDDIIATASHCLFRTSGEKPPGLSGFTFRPSNKSVRSIVRIAGVSNGGGAQNVVSGSVQLSIRPPIEATRDWALVRLAAPVCKGKALAISRMRGPDIEAHAVRGRVYQVAYHHDRPGWQLAFGGPCGISRNQTQSETMQIGRDFADTRDLVLHSCDTGGASSGSPLLVDTPAGPQVIAINVGTYVRTKVLIENGDVVHRYKSDTIANTAIGSNAFAEVLEDFTRTQIVSDRQSMRRLQDLLAERGHYRGRKDGLYGRLMRGAIESFERAENRRVTGLASTRLMEHLLLARRSTPRPIEGSMETGSVTTGKPGKAK